MVAQAEETIEHYKNARDKYHGSEWFRHAERWLELNEEREIQALMSAAIKESKLTEAPGRATRLQKLIKESRDRLGKSVGKGHVERAIETLALREKERRAKQGRSWRLGITWWPV